MVNILYSFVYCIVEQDHIKICSNFRTKNDDFFIINYKCSTQCNFVDNLWNIMGCHTLTTRILQSVCLSVDLAYQRRGFPNAQTLHLYT
jgi:hypothetical protein